MKIPKLLSRVSMRRVTETLVLAAIVALIPQRSAHAYVDPNSVGPIFQFLFPLFVAVASAYAFLKRSLLKIWHRVLGIAGTEKIREPDRGSDADVGGDA
jgi:hypothetical protein